MKATKSVVKSKADDNYETVTLELKNRMVVLKIKVFDTDVDTDQLCQIQYHNIMGEILTTSALLNRVGNMQADINNILAECNLDFELFYAQKYEEFKKKLLNHVVTSRSDKWVEPTSTEIGQAIIRTPEWKVKKMNIINVQKSKEYIDALYWSLKDKCEKVNKLTDKLRPDEFEKDLLEDTINGVMIVLRNKAIRG